MISFISTGTHALEPFCTAFPGTFTGTWITSRTARSQTCAIMECQHCRWQLSQVHHSSGPSYYSQWEKNFASRLLGSSCHRKSPSLSEELVVPCKGDCCYAQCRAGSSSKAGPGLHTGCKPPSSSPGFCLPLGLGRGLSVLLVLPLYGSSVSPAISPLKSKFQVSLGYKRFFPP